MAIAAATSQINARINSALKKNGDASLANAGFSPSQAIRALWELAERYADKPDTLRELLLPDEAKANELLEQKRRQHLLQVAREGAGIVKNAYAEVGLEWPSADDAPSYDELKMLAYEDRYASEMGWG